MTFAFEFLSEAARRCESKTPYPTEQSAQSFVRAHDCLRCVDGQVFSAYVCPYDQTHWHVGHMESAP